MMTPTMRRALEFFAENAGYSTPPGRMVCARDLARAEAEGSRRGWVVGWEPETECYCGEFDYSCACFVDRGTRRGDCACSVAILYSGWGDRRADIIGSLGGICSADSAYRRVVSAELMLDALQGEWIESERYTSLLERIAS